MARAKKAQSTSNPTPAWGKPIPLRLPERLLTDAQTAQDRLNLSQQEAVRLAAKIGLAALAQVDYDVEGIVARFALEMTEEKKPRRLTVKTPDHEQNPGQGQQARGPGARGARSASSGSG